ncbi:MAG: hypothetical protein ACYTG6_17325 [Planctomycetota bacterium]
MHGNQCLVTRMLIDFSLFTFNLRGGNPSRSRPGLPGAGLDRTRSDA